jgi:5,10-methylenetetrahydromethanopterin reductase
VKFAIAILNDGFPAFLERAALAEEAGFDRVCFGDSQSMYREAWVSHAALASCTSRVGLWLTVSNPVSRHLVVTASGAASMGELCGGRFHLALGTGFSSVAAIGREPASVDTLRSAVVGLRELWAGREASWEGRPCRLEWPAAAVPLSVSAGGPRTLRLAGELCDEVLVGAGLDADSVRTSLGHIACGSAAAGRATSPESWFYAKLSIGASRADAVEGIKGFLAGSAAFSFRDVESAVPAEFADGVRHVQRNYSLAEHARPGPNANSRMLDEFPGLAEFLADRFALVGSPGEIIVRLRALEALGVERLLLTAIGADPAEMIRAFAAEILPAVRDSSQPS